MSSSVPQSVTVFVRVLPTPFLTWSVLSIWLIFSKVSFLPPALWAYFSCGLAYVPFSQLVESFFWLLKPWLSHFGIPHYHSFFFLSFFLFLVLITHHVVISPSLLLFGLVSFCKLHESRDWICFAHCCVSSVWHCVWCTGKCSVSAGEGMNVSAHYT